jgi:hypothetical protein
VRAWAAWVAVIAAALLAPACGYRLDAGESRSDTSATVRPTMVAAADTMSAASSSPPVHRVTATPARAAVPPNAQGDPACPPMQAWGRDPSGQGVLVTYWAQDYEAVTVLVRTTTGTDRAQRAVLHRDELRLFEFPEINATAVREVLIMSNTARCFAIADPATFG